MFERRLRCRGFSVCILIVILVCAASSSASVDFIGNEPEIGTAGVSELTVRTSPIARILQMYFKVESPAADFKIGQDWSVFGFMSQYSRGQVSVAATPANMFNRWIQASGPLSPPTGSGPAMTTARRRKTIVLS